MTIKQKLRLKFAGVIVLAVFAGLLAYPKIVEKVPPIYNALNKLKINLGLDLQGGIHLEYAADVSQIESGKVGEAMQAVQDVIERRVNAFGVSEPLVYTTKSGMENRLVVELAGIKDINQAKDMIKETPFLEFKEQKETQVEKIPEEELNKENEEAKAKAQDLLKKVLAGEDFAELAKENSEDPGSKEDGGEYDFQKKGTFVPEYEDVIFNKDLKDGEIYPELVETDYGWHIIKRIEVRGEGDPAKSPEDDGGASDQEFKSAHILIAKHTQPQPQMEWVSTGLSGKNLENASVDWQGQGLSEPQVALKFDSEGVKLFAEITKRNLQKQVAIFLDGQIISAPTVQSEITNGEAVITGSGTIEEAKNLVKRLNEGALPVPITLISQQSVEASLGQASLAKSLKAGAIGLAVVLIFMIVYYRYLGLVASLALLIYTALMVTIFKLSTLTPWAITFTLSGIAGFVLSIGMAVDANILIFERIKEEIRNGRDILSAVDEGFRRAWPSIRDGNYSTILTSMILIWVGTGFVKGFAIILVIGVLVSMFTAIVLVKNILKFTMGPWAENKKWLVLRIKGKKNNP
jgi:protein-export membrane protein SecD